MNDKDSKDSMTEGENLEEDEDEEEGGVEIEEQSGNESEINEPEEEVILSAHNFLKQSLEEWLIELCSQFTNKYLLCLKPTTQHNWGDVIIYNLGKPGRTGHVHPLPECSQDIVKINK